MMRMIKDCGQTRLWILLARSPRRPGPSSLIRRKHMERLSFRCSRKSRRLQAHCPPCRAGINPGQNDPPDRGKAVRPPEPDQARSDRAPVIAPRQEQPLSSSLFTAIQRGDKSTVNEYLNRGTSPNEIMANGAPLLKNAVVSSAMPVAELLLSRGADVNARDASGKTALFWARRMNNEAFVQMLLKHGAQD